MSRFPYDGQKWHFSNETVRVWMSDATYQKHFRAYLEHLGIPTKTYLELMEHARQVSDRQYQAVQQFQANLDYWLTCEDPDVTVRQQRPSLPYERG